MPKIETEPKRETKSLQEIAKLIDGSVLNDAAVVVRGACGIREAQAGDITFLSDSSKASLLKSCKASAFIVGQDFPDSDRALIKTANPAQAFLKVLKLWKPTGRRVVPGVHPKAQVAKSAKLSESVSIGPGVVIEDDCAILKGTVIMANSFIGCRSRIGADVQIYPNVTVREDSVIGDRVILHSGVVIGSDGYGYERVNGQHVKLPQVGIVVLEADVEIGANACVDRARFGQTLIKKGTKIDNLVQVAHNVVIGENCLIVSQSGIAGSADVGDNVILAGQVGVAGHLKIGSNSIIGAQSGVFTSVPEGSVLLGSPPLPIRDEKERIVYMSRLKQLFKDVKALKAKFKKPSV